MNVKCLSCQNKAHSVPVSSGAVQMWSALSEQTQRWKGLPTLVLHSWGNLGMQSRRDCACDCSLSWCGEHSPLQMLMPSVMNSHVIHCLSLLYHSACRRTRLPCEPWFCHLQFMIKLLTWSTAQGVSTCFFFWGRAISFSVDFKWQRPVMKPLPSGTIFLFLMLTFFLHQP